MRSYDNAIDPQEVDDNKCLPDMPCERPDKCHLPVSALDSNSLTMLRELYAEDFEKFGYETEVRASRERFRLSASTRPHSVADAHSTAYAPWTADAPSTAYAPLHLMPPPADAIDFFFHFARSMDKI